MLEAMKFLNVFYRKTIFFYICMHVILILCNIYEYVNRFSYSIIISAHMTLAAGNHFLSNIPSQIYASYIYCAE